MSVLQKGGFDLMICCLLLSPPYLSVLCIMNKQLQCVFAVIFYFYFFVC